MDIGIILQLEEIAKHLKEIARLLAIIAENTSDT
jgi:hypothetical protein